MTAFFIAQIVAALAGATLLLTLRAWRLPVPLFVVSAWLAGTGMLAVERLILAQLGVGWGAITLASPWLAVAGVAVWRLRGERSTTMRAWVRRWQRLPGRLLHAGFVLDAAVMLAIIVWTAAMFWQATNQPLAGWDAWSIWFLKGRALYQAGGLPMEFFTDLRFLPYAHLDYPLLVPLTIAGTYAWTGDLDTLMKGWWPMLAGAAAVAMYWGLEGLVGRAARFSGLLLLVALPELSAHTVGYYVGYADLPLAVMVLFGGLFLYRWVRQQCSGDFALAALFFSLAGFTKNEGQVTAISGLALLVGLSVLRRRPMSDSAIAGIAAAAVLLPWHLQREALGLTSEFHPSLLAIVTAWPDRIGPITQALTALLTDTARFNHLWPVLPLLALAALVFAPQRWLTTLPALLLLMVQATADVVAYLITPNDLTFQLTTSADRVIFQSVPLALLLGTIHLGLLFDRPRDARSSLGVVPSPRRGRGTG